jgi:hypothetical protein
MRHGDWLSRLPRGAAAMIALAASGSPALAQFEDGSTLVQAAVQPSSATVHAGERVILAFTFDIQPFWHIYWANPGDSGGPTTIDVKVPEGFEVGEIIWSRPQVIPAPGSASPSVTYGYEGRAMLFVPVDAPPPGALADGTAEFIANVSWMVCKETCLLGSATLTASVATSAAPTPVRPGKREAGEAEDAGEAGGESGGEAGGVRSGNAREDRGDGRARVIRFDDPAVRRAFRDSVPVRLKRVKDHVIALDADARTLTLEGPASGHDRVMFIPNHTPGVSATVKEAVIEGDRFRVVLQWSIEERNTLGEQPEARGLVLLGAKLSDPAFDVSVPLKPRE